MEVVEVCILTTNLRCRDDPLQEESEDKEDKKPYRRPSNPWKDGDHVDQYYASKQAGDDPTNRGIGFAPVRNEQPRHPAQLSHAEK